MNRKPRILQICHDYKGPFRTVARQYAGCFADCDVKTVFLRGPQSASLAESIHGDVEFLTLGPGSLRGLKLGIISELGSMIADEPPDIIIAHRYKPLFIALALNARLKIGLVIGVMHEFGFLKRQMRTIFSRFWPDNVELLGVSQPVCDEIRQTHPHLADRVHYLPHAVEADSLFDSVSARHQLGIPLGVYCYGVIGRLVSKKNHNLLIDAFSAMPEGAVLAIVGDGPCKESLQQQVVRGGLGERVIFCGHQPDAKRFMKAFDAFVLPSGNEEAFGIVLLEAMAASVPILSTDAPGPASVLGGNAILFQSGNVEDLERGLTEIQSMGREASDEMAAAALRHLGANYSIGSMLQTMRSLPPVVNVAPVTM